VGVILPGLMMAGFGVPLGLRAATNAAGIGSALLIVGGLARAAAGVFLPDPPGDALHPTFAARVHNGASVMYGVTFTLAAGIAAPGDVGLFQRAWLGSLNTWMPVFACRVRVQSRR